VNVAQSGAMCRRIRAQAGPVSPRVKTSNARETVGYCLLGSNGRISPAQHAVSRETEADERFDHQTLVWGTESERRFT